MVEIVAELSSNHLGQLDNALALIDAAAKAGANAVKFQCWTPDTMAREPSRIIEEGPWAGKTLGQLYRECWTPWDWFPDMIAKANELSIPWFSSVFDEGALGFLEACGCLRYKISSFELTDLDLIRKVGELGKPMVMSIGMASDGEIDAAIEAAGYGDRTLLHCVSAYPAPIEDMNLVRLQPGDGLSDHSLGWMAPVCAAALGATMIEKHLTLSRERGGPDASFALEPAEFAEMVEYVRLAEMARGGFEGGPPASEVYGWLRRGSEGRG